LHQTQDAASAPSIVSPLFGFPCPPPSKLVRQISRSNQKLLLRCNLNYESNSYIKGRVVLKIAACNIYVGESTDLV
jgi:hypothetical protein